MPPFVLRRWYGPGHGLMWIKLPFLQILPHALAGAHHRCAAGTKSEEGRGEEEGGSEAGEAF